MPREPNFACLTGQNALETANKVQAFVLGKISVGL